MWLLLLLFNFTLAQIPSSCDWTANVLHCEDETFAWDDLSEYQLQYITLIRCKISGLECSSLPDTVQRLVLNGSTDLQNNNCNYCRCRKIYTSKYI